MGREKGYTRNTVMCFVCWKHCKMLKRVKSWLIALHSDGTIHYWNSK